MKRVAVIGCGAIGSLFAAHLAQKGECEVWAYDLDQAHVDAINADGLRLTGVGEAHGHLQATTDPGALPACDYAIVATKAMHTESAMRATSRALAGGAVCTVQNGVGNEEAIAPYVPRVIRGTTFPAGKLLEPGVVQQDTGGETTIGPFEPKPASMDEVHELAGLLDRSGMTTTALADARGAQWCKVIFNAATNPLGALSGLTHGQACDVPPLRVLMSALVAEGRAVCEAQGIVLDADPEALIDHAARPEVAYGHKASMLQDIEARRTPEIDYLNGGIARFGAELGVPSPLNDTIAALIRGIEASWTKGND